MPAKIIEYNGEKKTVAQWSKATGLAVGTIRDRLAAGWAIDKTLSTAIGAKYDGSIGKLMRTGVLNSLMKVWDESGRAEFEKQLKERFKEDAIKVVQSFQNMFPREVETGNDKPNCAIQINNIMPEKEFNTRYTPIGVA